MKKVILSALLCAGFAFASSAQIQTTPQTSENVGMDPIKQGNWMVGGSIGSLGYSFENKSFNIEVSPRAGYFVSDGLAIGAETSLGFTAISDEDNAYTYGIAPFVRYYFPGGASQSGRFFGQGDIGIAGSNVGDAVSLAVGANVGYAHFVTRSVALEATLGYNYRKTDINLGNKSSGLGVGLGFQIYLPGKR